MRTRQVHILFPSGFLSGVLWLALLLPATPTLITAQDFSYFREEAPETLFGFSIGDAEVEFFVSGSWKTSLAGVFGAAFHPPFEVGGGTTTVPYAVPGFTDPILSNQANVALTILILEQFFLDAAFVEPLVLSSMLGGYIGSETDFLRYLAVGYDQFAFGPYPFLSLGGSGNAGPGAEAFLVGQDTEYEFVLRIEESDTVRRYFRGTREVFETRVDLRNYERGAAFVLPDSNVSDLRLYIQDENGTPAQLADGSPTAERYRRLNLDQDAVVDTEAGIVYLRSPVTAQLAVSYSVDGDFVGTNDANGQDAVFGLTNGAPDPGRPIDFSFSGTDFDDLISELGRSTDQVRRTIESRPALVLYAPGYYSPFELLGLYTAPSGTNEDAQISLRYHAGEERDAPTAPRAFVDERFSTEQQLIIRIGDPTGPVRGPYSRYPFLTPTDAYPAGHPELYDVAGASPVPVDLVITSFGPPGDLTVGGEVLPATVEVYRNGILDPAGGIDHESGQVFFGSDLGTSERVELRYRTAGGGAGSDIVFGAAGRYGFAAAGTVSFGAGLRWRLSPELYATEPEEHQGAVLAGAGLDWSEGPAQISADLSFSFRHPNSTGLLSLASMNGARRSVSARASALAPAAAPDSELPGTAALDAGSRRPPSYRNYKSGSVYLDVDSTPVPDPVDGAVGPYVAAVAGLEGRVLVNEFAFASGGDWQATRLGLAAGTAAPTGLELSWKLDGGPGAAAPDTSDLEVYIDIGAIGEDADGDGSLAAEAGPAAGGYPFATLTVPGDPETIDGEDLNGNGVLDKEIPQRIVRRAVAPPGAGAFERLSLEFTPAERSRLSQELRAIRVTVVHGGSGPVAGRLVVGEITLSGSALRVVADNPADTFAREVDLDHEGIEDAGNTGSEGRILSRANPGRVLELAQDTPGRVSVIADRTHFRVGDYGRISFFVYPVSVTSGDGLLLFAGSYGPEAAELTAGDPVYVARIPMPAAGVWSRVDLDLETGAVTVNGIEQAPDSTDYLGFAAERAGKLGPNQRITTVAVGVESVGSTRVYVDEIYAADARGLATLNAGILSSIRYQGNLVEAGGFPIIGSPSVRVRADAGIPFAETAASASLGTDLAATLIGIQAGLRIDAEFQAAANDPAQIRALGHSFVIPSVASPVTVGTRFLRLYGEAPVETAQLDVGFRVPETLGGQISAAVRTDKSIQTRSWTGRFGSATAGVPVSGEAALSLSQVSNAEVDVTRDYTHAWFENFPRLFSTAGEAEQERRVEGQVDTGLDLEGLTLSSLVSAQTRSDTRGFSSSGAIHLGVSAAVQDAGVTFGLEYTRSHALGESLARIGDGTTFWNDVETWVDRTTGFSFLMEPFPVVDLFSPSLTADFRSATATSETASFSTQGNLYVTRRIGTTPWDVVVPSALRMGWRRSVDRSEDSVASEQELNVSVTSIAANVFGTLGQAPFFDFYETDSLSSRIGLTVEFDGTDAVEPASADLTFRTTVGVDGPRREDIGRPAFIASLKNDLSIGLVSNTVVNATTASLLWRTKPRTLFDIEETAFLFESGGYLENREVVEVTGRSVPSNIESSRLQVTLDHTTALVVPDTGEIAVSAAFSLGGRPLILETGRDMLTFIGFRLVLSGELRF